MPSVPTGAEQQHLGVEQPGLSLRPDLGQQQVTAVALLLLAREDLGDVDLVAAVLPQRDAAGHGRDVRVAEQVGERVGSERRALAGGAVEDDALAAVGDRALDAGLQVPARDVDRAGDVAAIPLLGVAYVDQRDAVAQVL
jgi:hypothetical protein